MSINRSKALLPQLRFPEFVDVTNLPFKALDEIAHVGRGKRLTKSQLDPGGKFPVYSGGITPMGYYGNFNQPANTVTVVKYGTAGFVNYINQKFWANDVCYCIKPADGRVLHNKYLYYSLKSMQKSIQSLTMDAIPAHLPTDSIKRFHIPIPSLSEQHKIAECLGSLDELISAQERKIEVLRKHKQGLMQKLFPQSGESVPQLRFPEFVDYPEWKYRQLSDVLHYEQPVKYLVRNSQYESSGTPVLTANKSFILGYTCETDGVYHDLPVIIFDDFTTDSKYVDFPFKVKSSAIKILRARGSNHLRLVYDLMSRIRFDPAEHKRYYISQYQYLKIPLSHISEQQKIAECLGSLDELISAQERKIEVLRKHKQGLMQQLFPNPHRNE